MKFLLTVAVLLATTLAHADLIPPNAVPSSFRKSAIESINGLDNRLDVVEASVSTAADGNGNLRVARVTYNTQDSSTTFGSIGAHGLGVYLPAKAIIVRSYINIVTQFVDSGSGTVALSCEDADNIKTATDITGSSAGALIEGASTGAISAAVTSIAAACQITATVAGAAQTAGKLNAFVEYVIGD